MDRKFDQEGMNGNNLIIRRKLVPVRDSLIQQLIEAPRGSVFYYDFSDVRGINSSGVDEVIAKIIIYIIDNGLDVFVYLRNLQEKDYEHRYNIDNALKLRSKIGIVEREKSDQAYFLGDISKSLKIILTIVYKEKKVTARDMADKTGKKITLVSTYLNQLYKYRMVQRVEENLEEGGREYIYSSLF